MSYLIRLETTVNGGFQMLIDSTYQESTIKPQMTVPLKVRLTIFLEVSERFP